MSDAALGMFESTDTWKRYSNHARNTAHTRFCRDLVIPRYEAFYQQVLQRTPNEV
jgi:hypothetical protein